MVMTASQAVRTERLAARSERLARHTANCEALAAAYARRRNCSLRLLRPDIDALLTETMATELWEVGFDPDRFLDSLPAWGKRRYRLV